MISSLSSFFTFHSLSNPTGTCSSSRLRREPPLIINLLRMQLVIKHLILLNRVIVINVLRVILTVVVIRLDRVIILARVKAVHLFY